MSRPAFETAIVDRTVRDPTVALFRERRIILPTLTELAKPDTIPAAIVKALAAVEPDAPAALNLFRVHWCGFSFGNGCSEGVTETSLFGSEKKRTIPIKANV